MMDVATVQDAMGDGVMTKKMDTTAWAAKFLVFNLTNSNEEVRELVNNLSFRQALSIAASHAYGAPWSRYRQR